jgi:hypothetical protein
LTPAVRSTILAVRHEDLTTRRPREPANNQGLVGYWKLDEADGYVAEDSSGYANEGDVWATWAKGAFGSAIFCDDDASSVIVPDDPTLHFGTSDFSIELWMCPTMLKIESKDARPRFMSKDHYPHTWWNLNVTTDGKLDSVQDISPAFTGALDVEGGDLSIGSAWQPFVGLLDEVKIYNRALTESEIKVSYEQGKGSRTDTAYQLVE